MNEQNLNYMPANPYQEAADRFTRASFDYANAKRDELTTDAELARLSDEYDAASANLAAFEVTPGIPKPEYRTAWELS